MFMQTTQQLEKELNRLADIVHDESKTKDEQADAEIAWQDIRYSTEYLETRTKKY